jgi:glycosyltransferase 2 family protein
VTALVRSTWVRVAVTAAILAYLFRHVDAGEAMRALVGVNPWALLVTAALVALDRVVMIRRWVLLLRASRVPVSTREAARIFLVSSFVGSFLPAGLGGDAARAWSLSRHTSQGSAALASVAVDRLLGVIAIALLGAVGALAWSRHQSGPLQTWTMAIGVVVIVGTILALFVDRLLDVLLPASLRGRGVGERFSRLADAVASYRKTPRVLASVLAWSLAVQVLRVLQAWVLGLGLGIRVPFGYYLVFMPIGLLMLLLPISVSGFGLPQGVIVWLLQPVGVAKETAFALSTLIVLSGIAANLPGAWLWLRRRE